MAKTVKTDAEIFEFPAFDATNVQDQFRAFAEKGSEQAKEFYAKAKTAAEDSQKVVQDTFDSAKAHGSELTLKAIANARKNAETGFAHLEALVGAKSVSDFIELQTAYLRKQGELLVDQAKEFADAAKVAAEDVAKPARKAAEKAGKAA